MSKVAEPGLETVIVFARLDVLRPWFPKARLVGLTLIAGDVPVPESPTLSGDDDALDVTVIEPLAEPVAVGWNVAEIVQFPDGASVPTHVDPADAKAAPVTAVLKVSVAVPVLVRVVESAPLVVPTRTLPKFKAGLRVTAGAGGGVPVPESEADGVVESDKGASKLPTRLPELLGWKLTSTGQESPAVPDIAKMTPEQASADFAKSPETVTVPTVTVAPPSRFESVKVCAPLVVPTV